MATTEVIKGSDFMISILQDGVYKDICYSTDCQINQTLEAREITSAAAGVWRDFIGGRLGYDISVPGAIAFRHQMNYLQLEAFMHNRVKVQWEASNSDNGGVVHSGTIIITSLNLTSQTRDIMRFDMTALGCKAKSTQLLPITVQVYLADTSGVRLAGCPNPYPVTILWYDGTVVGIANNADDVITQFNSYPGNTDFQLTSYTGGCDFTMLVQWNAPFIPEFIIAIPTPGLAMWTGTGDEAISNDQDNDEVISPNYTV
jgi:predicted secreted protein